VLGHVSKDRNFNKEELNQLDWIDQVKYDRVEFLRWTSLFPRRNRKGDAYDG